MFSQSRIHPGTILTSQCKLNYWAWSSKRQLVITACSWGRAEHMVPIILQKSTPFLWNATLVSSFNGVSNNLHCPTSQGNGFIICFNLRHSAAKCHQNALRLHCNALIPLVCVCVCVPTVRLLCERNGISALAATAWVWKCCQASV